MLFPNRPKKTRMNFLGYPEEKITTIYNGIDKRFFEDGEYSRDDLKKELWNFRKIYFVSGDA